MWYSTLSKVGIFVYRDSLTQAVNALPEMLGWGEPLGE